jgi:5'-3' exonuclease
MIELLSYTPVKVYSIPLVEGDTILAYVVRELARRDSDKEIIIFSHDKDMFQLISEKVTICYRDKKTRLIKELSIADINEIWERIISRPVRLKELAEKTKNQIISFESLPYYRALLGDESDGIPGIRGVGSAMVSTLIHLQQMLGIEKFPDVSSFYTFLEVAQKFESDLPVLFKNLGLRAPRVKLARLSEFLSSKEEKEIFERNLDLMDFTRAIENEITPTILSTLYSELDGSKKYHSEDFLEFVREYDLNSEPDYQRWHLINKALEAKDFTIVANQQVSKARDLKTLFESLCSRLKVEE